MHEHGFSEMKKRMFHIGDVLSVTTGYVVACRGLPAIHQLQDYMAARPLSTEDRIQYAGAIRQQLLDQFPEFTGFSDDDIPPSELLGVWLERRAREFGEYVYVHRLPRDHP